MGSKNERGGKVKQVLAPNIKIGCSQKVDMGFGFGIKVEIDGKELPFVTGAIVELSNESFPMVTLFLHGDIEIEEQLAAQIKLIADDKQKGGQ